jgi:hypothetical protein
MLTDNSLCTGTTHPTCAACARKVWPVSRLLGESGHEQWISHIGPPIDLSAGRCVEFREQEKSGVSG